MTVTGFHEGELAVQRAAGVEDHAARLAGMLAPGQLSGGASRFLTDRDFAVVTARDEAGALWASPLFDQPGFLAGDGTVLTVRARPGEDDPLATLPTGQPVGLIAIEFATRRRVRVNGTLAGTSIDGLQIDVDQAFGNCPRYIQQRHLRHELAAGSHAARRFGWQQRPGEVDRLVEQADTFFLGTVHPTRGADASHRGGPPGFVRVDGGSLWWPDYPGNNMFNSLGNLAVDDTAALLFVDWRTGDTVQLSGSARVEQVPPGAGGDDGATGRRVRFVPLRVVTGRGTIRSLPRPHR